MRARKPRLVDRSRAFLRAYTHGLERDDLPRLFTRDTREAYRFFARNIDEEALRGLPWHRRWFTRARLFFWAFTLRLSPARRILYGVGLLLCLFGFLQLFRGFSNSSLPFFFGPGADISVPHPSFAPGASSLFVGFLLVNLLVLLEVADRLSLKNDLEIAREIQYAMLPQAKYDSPTFEAFGLTRPANTVGGDFYDVLPLPDGRIVVTIGDVAGKGSPAALLMALLLAMFRTLVDEGLEAAALAERLNRQVCRHSPASRFITLFFAACDPVTGRLMYVNAGHMPALLRRRDGAFEHLASGGIALGMFDHSKYEAHEARMEPGDTLVLYSDGVTEAEDHHGQPFEEAGLESAVEANVHAKPTALAQAILKAVEHHARQTSLADDLTVLVVARKMSPPDTAPPPPDRSPAPPCAD
jgi:serine phosphatase RsbU (regulator of sigma subunit)